MVCIYCGSYATKVNNSRLQKRLNNIWRRRQCLTCSSIFTTREHAELETSLMVEGSENGLTPFCRDKLFAAVYESCKHRPAAAADASSLTQTIVAHVMDKQSNGVVQSRYIASTALKALERFDRTAAAIYAAYHPA